MAKEPLYVELYNTLRAGIIEGKYKQGELLPTEAELTEEFFLSRVTIKKAMKLLIDDGYIKRIPGRGTYVNAVIGRDAALCNKTIGVVLSNVDNPFAVNLLVSLQKHAESAGYSVVFKNSLDTIENEKRAINDLLSMNVDGIIIQPLRNEYYNKSIIKLYMKNFPVVLADRSLPGFPIPVVSTDNYTATIAAVDYLLSKGHKNVGFFSLDSQMTSSIDDRLNGFKSAFFDKDLPLSNHNIYSIISLDALRDTQWRENVERLKEYLCENNKITCLFSSEFIVTKLLCCAIKELGKKIPDDYSLFMFDWAEDLAGLCISHIRQDENAMGAMAIEVLQKKISNLPLSNKTFVPFSLVEGESVKSI